MCALQKRAGILHCDIRKRPCRAIRKSGAYHCGAWAPTGGAARSDAAGHARLEGVYVAAQRENTLATDAYAVGALDLLDTLKLEDKLLRSVRVRLVKRDPVPLMTLRGTMRELSAGIGAASADGVASIRVATTEKSVGESGGREATDSEGRTNIVVEYHVIQKLRS